MNDAGTRTLLAHNNLCVCMCKWAMSNTHSSKDNDCEMNENSNTHKLQRLLLLTLFEIFGFVYQPNARYRCVCCRCRCHSRWSKMFDNNANPGWFDIAIERWTWMRNIVQWLSHLIYIIIFKRSTLCITVFPIPWMGGSEKEHVYLCVYVYPKMANCCCLLLL